MKTYMPKGNDADKKWYIIDAEGKVLGRLATEVAKILRGKHKPTYTPFMDMGDYVIIINADKVVLSGNKWNDKKYRYHTGYVGGLKEIQYRKLMAEKPEKAMTLAIKGMLPHNTIGANSLTRLRVYKGAEHKHEAQKPEMYTGEIK